MHMFLELEKNDLEAIKSYRLPSFNEIPDVGLYLNQCATYINRYLEPLFNITITESMISNYVKKKLIDNPVKKQYSREMIAYLLFIALSKSVASLDDIQLLINIQKKKYSADISYEFFKKEFEAILLTVFGLENTKDRVGEEKTLEEELVGKIIVTIAHKLYVDKAFKVLRDNAKEK